MQLEIARPWALLLLPVLAGIIIWLARRIRSRSRTRRIGEALIRCMVVAFLVLALSGVSIRKSSDMTTTVFLVDLSDSLKGAHGEETQFVQSAISHMPDKNQSGIVVFGSDAQIEQFVSEKKIFTDFQSQVIGSATNLEQAVQTALALFPDETAHRLVLLTDGAENEGNLNNLVSSFAGTDIEFKVVSYDSSIKDEVYVSDVSLPDIIHQGDRFQVQVDIYSTKAADAKVSLYSGRTLKGQKEVVLQKGSNRLVFSDQGVEGGLKSYRVTVESENDTVSVNNTYSAFTTVEAQPKILLVEGKKGQSRAFVKILKACNYDYEVVTPSGVPAQITDLNQYQSVILLDVYADDLRKGFMDAAQTYVKDYAGGLIAIGGPNSFALGNYKDTPLEQILPVKMDLEGEKQVPKLAMTMVIDHSGSMSASSAGNSSVTCMDIAKHAAVNALDSLREIDEVGVLAFDDGFTWSVPLQKAVDTEEIVSWIAGITSGGGTSIYPALNEAVDKMKNSDAVLKHIILLTDGQDGYHQYKPVLDAMKKNGITLSTVAVGTDADSAVLKSLAEKGGGRYYYSDGGTALPRIFAQEVYLSAKSYLIHESFTPVVVNSHEVIQNVFSEGSPDLLGYIASTPKPAATVILESPRNDPILTVWQYGLGRSIAWNSDGTNEWTGNFAGWANYAALWRNLIDWTISESDLGKDILRVEQQASSAVITYETEDYTAETDISALITGEDGKAHQVKLKASAPGVYQAEIPLDKAGVYSINVRNRNGSEMIKNINTATAMQYSREYRYAEVSNNLKSFTEKVSGRYISRSEEVFDTKLTGAMARTNLTNALLLAAVFLFVFDVIMRRMHIDWLAGIAGGLKKAVSKKTVSKKTVSKTTVFKAAGSQTGASVNRKETISRAERIHKPESDFGKDAEKTVSGKKGKGVSGKKMEGPSEKKMEGVIDTEALLKKKKERNL